MCRAGSTKTALALGRRRRLDLQRRVCPVTPGVRRISWVFEDPKGLPLERVRAIRDEIEKSVEQLVRELDAEATAA